MLTKEELLQKGISEDVADEILAAASTDADNENSLQTLEKALNDPGYQDLFKANGGDDEEDEDEDKDYDESYMRKYMKRYMKENKSAVGKMAKDVGIFGGEMKKAVEGFDFDATGAVVEMADLKPVLEAQVEYNEVLTKAVQEISGAMESIRIQNAQAYDLMQKAAAVQVETAKGLDGFLNTPTGRKGVTANVDMQKAGQPNTGNTKLIYDTLMKATMNKDQKAGLILSAYESCGKNLARLNESQKSYINDLIQQEGK
jgi:hypothetical protein